MTSSIFEVLGKLARLEQRVGREQCPAGNRTLHFLDFLRFPGFRRELVAVRIEANTDFAALQNGFFGREFDQRFESGLFLFEFPVTAGRADGQRDHRRQHANDHDDDQQFDEREAGGGMLPATAATATRRSTSIFSTPTGCRSWPIAG